MHKIEERAVQNFLLFRYKHADIMGFLSIKVVRDFGALGALSTGVLVGKITKNSQDGNDNTQSTVSKETKVNA